MAIMPVSQIELCALINQLLRESDDPRLNDVSMDNDNDSGEVIVTWDDNGTLQDFVVKPSETDREYDDDNVAW